MKPFGELAAFSNLEDVVGLLEPLMLEDGHAHVEDRDAAGGLPRKAPVMRVSVESDVRASLIQSVCQVTRAEEGEDLRRLALDSGADGRIVQYSHPPLRPEPPQLDLESPRLQEAL